MTDPSGGSAVERMDPSKDFKIQGIEKYFPLWNARGMNVDTNLCGALVPKATERHDAHDVGCNTRTRKLNHTNLYSMKWLSFGGYPVYVS